MRRFLHILLELFCWLQLFLLPILLTSVIFFVVVLHAGELRWMHFLTLIPGAIAGFFLAERTRQRTGCLHFMQGFTGLREDR